MANEITPTADGEKNDGTAVGEEGRVLCSGFDTLVLALSICWKNDEFFKLLTQLKINAVAQKAPMPGAIEAGGDRWIFNVRPHGTEGYAFLLNSHDYNIKLVQSMIPRARPSAMVEIRSATLWEFGPNKAVERILNLLISQGADIDKAMASRGDPCLDILLPEAIWNAELPRKSVKRASSGGIYLDDDVLCGFKIGAGNILVRLYDKPYEIKTKSKKSWMYDLWKLKEVPAGSRIVRVEFQLRREALQELGIDTIWELLNHSGNLWAYLTEKWIKFQDCPEIHHTQQKTLPWWKTVQRGFVGAQGSCPLIRAKSINANKVQISQQLFGQLSSVLALESDGDITPGGEIQIEEPLSKVIECAALIGMNPSKLYERVRRKMARYVQDIEKFRKAQEERKAKGLPVLQRKKGGVA